VRLASAAAEYHRGVGLPVRDPMSSAVSRATDAAKPATVVVRAPAETRFQLRDVISYRPLVRALASRDLKVRYKQSALGPAWLVFQPLALLAAFAVGFRSIANVRTAGVPYVLFALSGLVVWTYFQAVTMFAVGSIINNYTLVRWTSCPRVVLPIASLISNLPSLLITTVASVITAGVMGYLWLGSLLLPAIFVWQFFLVLAFALFVSSISVRARDVISVMPFLLQVMVFLVPVGYQTKQLSPILRGVISVNPLTGLIDAVRWSLLGVKPSIPAVSISITLTIVGVLLAWRFFTRFEPHMADEI
jgi:homopolymeric O-antigen transport system permease protein